MAEHTVGKGEVVRDVRTVDVRGGTAVYGETSSGRLLRFYVFANPSGPQGWWGDADLIDGYTPAEANELYAEQSAGERYVSAWAVQA